jgi:uncharacterized membrane protein
MRKRLAWLAGAIGLAWLVAFLRRQRPAPVWTEPAEPEAKPEPDDRAEELRRTLEESRAAAEQVASEPEQPSEPEPSDLAARRDEVHDRGRAALEEMDPPAQE